MAKDSHYLQTTRLILPVLLSAFGRENKNTGTLLIAGDKVASDYWCPPLLCVGRYTGADTLRGRTQGGGGAKYGWAGLRDGRGLASVVFVGVSTAEVGGREVPELWFASSEALLMGGCCTCSRVPSG